MLKRKFPIYEGFDFDEDNLSDEDISKEVNSSQRRSILNMIYEDFLKKYNELSSIRYLPSIDYSISTEYIRDLSPRIAEFAYSKGSQAPMVRILVGPETFLKINLGTEFKIDLKKSSSARRELTEIMDYLDFEKTFTAKYNKDNDSKFEILPSVNLIYIDSKTFAETMLFYAKDLGFLIQQCSVLYINGKTIGETNIPPVSSGVDRIITSWENSSIINDRFQFNKLSYKQKEQFVSDFYDGDQEAFELRYM